MLSMIIGSAAGFLIVDRCHNSRDLDVPCTERLTAAVVNISPLVIRVPEVLIVHRAMMTPIRLPYFDALYSIRNLFTPTERQRPWRLYLTPGLFPAVALSTAYYAYVPRISRAWLMDMGANGGNSPNQTFSRFLAHAIVAVLTTAIMTPIEVIIVRLSMQYHNAAAPVFTTAVAQESGDHRPEAVVYGEDNVIQMRKCRDPYTGLLDCAKRIVVEEGWSTLYLGWWITMLFSIL
ncbi:hypothetical protein CONPUDRAFT_91208 [Coniophora puteana RWD-64-598 SS2]|uniref:Mitochondrial carrier n=1 Tax=Coniophora puteana (strain RWD-64-598) TaxID=741705 RepID=A0A5M3MLR0_CONPW|nr:uncharacterized protein CONPUDRAFT_91208 [Coniophora puteana RWD-64-598 SS2]EIW80043.1 hypothetical protein CONPUDRAFT_91208 [Coniophora puteana RWD-64-598 SS2]